MGLGLRNFTHRTQTGEALLDTENGEELMHVQAGVDIVFNSFPPYSHGTLYISTKQVIWVSDVEKDKGYAVDFLSISLHAVSTDPNAYPLPCLYAQRVSLCVKANLLPCDFHKTASPLMAVYIIEIPSSESLVHSAAFFRIDTEAEEDDSDDLDSECNVILNLSKIREMRLIPSDPTQLDTLFEVFCECAELNPEPNDEEGEGEEHDWVFNTDQTEDEEAEEEVYNSQNPANSLGQSNGNHDLAHAVLELQINDKRFEDAEEMENSGDGTQR